MVDSTSKRGEPDRSLISLEQDHEVTYWMQRFDVTEDLLRQAVRSVGNHVDKVEQWLRSR